MAETGAKETRSGRVGGLGGGSLPAGPVLRGDPGRHHLFRRRGGGGVAGAAACGKASSGEVWFFIDDNLTNTVLSSTQKFTISKNISRVGCDRGNCAVVLDISISNILLKSGQKTLHYDAKRCIWNGRDAVGALSRKNHLPFRPRDRILPHLHDSTSRYSLPTSGRRTIGRHHGWDRSILRLIGSPPATGPLRSPGSRLPHSPGTRCLYPCFPAFLQIYGNRLNARLIGVKLRSVSVAGRSIGHFLDRIFHEHAAIRHQARFDWFHLGRG